MANDRTAGETVLVADPAAVSQARATLQRSLDEAGVERARQQDALLLLSEVLTNAIQHGSRVGDRIAVAWILDRDVLKIAVVDSAVEDGGPHVRPPDEERENGRGMLIVDRLADRWDERVTRGARQVSIRVRV